MSLKELCIDESWSLFLDRDGVINRRIVGDYVKSWEEFEFLPGVLDSLKLFDEKFLRILVVSNQQGVGKGLMTEEDVNRIHRKMLNEIDNSGGRVDMVYFSKYLEEQNHPMRKPNPGMALLAKREFNRIELEKSIMVGDSPSDMEFGKRVGMYTVFIGDRSTENNDSLVDFYFTDLQEFAKNL